MKIRNCHQNDLANAASFIQKFNSTEGQHCLHLDKEASIILSDIENLPNPFSESFFMIENNNQEIEAMIGWDFDLEKETGWLYGPFYKPNISSSNLDQLLKTILDSQPKIKRVFGFFEDTALNSIKLYEKHEFQIRSKATVLEFIFINKNKVTENPKVSHCTVEISLLEKLHKQSFEIQYLNASEILEKSTEKKYFLKCQHDKDKLLGYIFAEDNGIDSNEVYIHFLATDPDNRRNGIATNLIKNAIQWANFLGREKVCLTVQTANEGGIKLYNAIGFRILYNGVSLMLHK